MKRLMMLLMLWTGLITAVYIVNAAKLSRNAPAATTDNSNFVSADPAYLSYHPYTGPTASGPWTSNPYTAYKNAIRPDPAAGETRWYTYKAGPRGTRSEKGRL